MNIPDDMTPFHSSSDSAHYVPAGAEPYNVAGPCCECGHVHDGYDPDEVSPCGHYHHEECPNLP